MLNEVEISSRNDEDPRVSASGLNENNHSLPSLDEHVANTHLHTNFFSIKDEAWASLKLMTKAKLNILFIFGPVAVFTSSVGLSEALTFCFAGLALIPCAERLSFVTEQVAEHTNETIGALLNATFGNAPEFLISSAALRSGFYRVVQLTLLGSMLTNLLFVFGLSCFIGGLQWQVQELRITSGNVSIGMLLTATMGLVLPAALKLGNESTVKEDTEKSMTDDGDILTESDIMFSRINAMVMVVGYISYLIFQLGSHKEEFDYDGDEYAAFGGGHNIVRTPHYNANRRKPATKRNDFCLKKCFVMRYCPDVHSNDTESLFEHDTENDLHSNFEEEIYPNEEIELTNGATRRNIGENSRRNQTGRVNRSVAFAPSNRSSLESDEEISSLFTTRNSKDKSSDKAEDEEEIIEEPMTMRMGLVWLGIITAAISILSDLIVETIDGFASGSSMSEVFTSVIIIPFFSNIAEQVSAVIFAYRNKMDLCIGVTVGSAIQIGQFVMPGCVLVGWMMDRSMTLYFRAYETICLLLGVLCVAAVLQGGTTNWLVGIFFVGVFTMIAAGFALHENEELSTGAEQK